MGRAGAAAAPTSLGPRPRWPPEAHHRRDIIDAIGYVAHNGCVWRALPCDFPPWRTVYGFSWRWNANGATTRLHDQLRTNVQLAAGRNPTPSAAIIDSKGNGRVGHAGRSRQLLP